MPSLSKSGTIIVVPCFNEERRLRFSAFDTFLAGSGAAHILFVNDGSRDATLPLLCRFQQGHPSSCTVASLSENRGKAEAVRQGLLAAIDRGAGVVGYWDADLAAPLKEIALMEDVLARDETTEIVIGIRFPLLGRRIRRTAVRGTMGRLSALLTHTLTRLRTRDTQCGAKLFRVTSELRRALATPFRSQWLFDVELLMRLRLHHSQFDEIAYEFPLECWAEQPGSHVRASYYLGALRELVRIALDGGRQAKTIPGALAVAPLTIVKGPWWRTRQGEDRRAA